jgi:hypothetical protein
VSPRISCGAVVALVLSLGCTRQADIEWSESRPAPPELAAADAIALGAGDSIRATAASASSVPRFPAQCAESIRVARDERGGQTYAVWWSVRPDSTADLVVAYSADGREWSAAVRVDSLDAGRVACRRPQPAIAADGDNVYVAYAMAAREGPGIFASHSMDRGVTFHSPVPVVYGANIGRSAIAARGNTVVVAYEDPNTNPQRVAVAFSRTMGHPFDSRTIVSPATGAASRPRVALGDHVLAVVWQQGDGDSASTAASLMRTGVIR